MVELKKPTLKEIRRNPVWLSLRKRYPGKKNLEEKGRKEEIKEIKEEEKKTKQDQKGKMESEEEEGDTIEEGEEVEEIYHDTVKEEGNTEDLKKEEKEEKEENVESEIEVIQHVGDGTVPGQDILTMPLEKTMEIIVRLKEVKI